MFPAADDLRQRLLISTLIESTEPVRVEESGEEEEGDEGEDERAEESGHGADGAEEPHFWQLSLLVRAVKSDLGSPSRTCTQGED